MLALTAITITAVMAATAIRNHAIEGLVSGIAAIAGFVGGTAALALTERNEVIIVVTMIFEMAVLVFALLWGLN